LPAGIEHDPFHEHLAGALESAARLSALPPTCFDCGPVHNRRA
jgi:hypothetical protein